MPVYVYGCPTHGTFEVIQNLGDPSAKCPICGLKGAREMTSPVRITVNQLERLPYGSGARGRFVSHTETGGCDILVPSFGAMEKEEVDYVTQGAIEKEKDRVRKYRRERPVAQKIETLRSLAYRTKPGQRAKAIKQAIK